MGECVSDLTHTTLTSLMMNSLDSGNVSLEFTGYCCDIFHCLSQLSSYTQLTELILHLRGQDSTTADGNQLTSSSFLESLKIECIFYIFPIALPLTIPQFIGLQQNNLHTLLLCKVRRGNSDMNLPF